MELKDLHTIQKADKYTQDGREELLKATEDKRYKPGEISEATGLQKQPDGSWAPPKNGAPKGATQTAKAKEIPFNPKNLEIKEKNKNGEWETNKLDPEDLLEEMQEMKKEYAGNPQKTEHIDAEIRGLQTYIKNQKEKSSPASQKPVEKQNSYPKEWESGTPKTPDELIAFNVDYGGDIGMIKNKKLLQNAIDMSYRVSTIGVEDPDAYQNKLQKFRADCKKRIQELQNKTTDKVPLTGDTKIRVRK